MAIKQLATCATSVLAALLLNPDTNIMTDAEKTKLAALQVIEGQVNLSSLGFGPSNSESDNANIFLEALDMNVAGEIGHILIDTIGTIPLGQVNKTGVNNLKISSIPGVVLKGNISTSTPGNPALIQLGGTSGGTTTLVSSVSSGATSITVANGALLSVGQRFQMASGDAATGEYWSGVTGVAGFGRINKQEMNYVKSKVGNVIELQYPLIDSYNASSFTVTITPINASVNIEVDGLSSYNDVADDPALTNGNGPVGFRFRYIDNIRISNVNAKQWQNSVGLIEYCWGGWVKDGSLVGRDGEMPDDCYYGWSDRGSYHIQYSGTLGKFMRRVYDTSMVGIARFLSQSNVDAVWCNGSGYGSHFAQFVHYHDNRVRYSNTAFIHRGKDMISHDNDLHGAYRIGGSNGSGSDLPSNGTIVISNETIVAYDTGDTKIIYIQGSYDDLHIDGGRITNAIESPIYIDGRQRLKTTIMNLVSSCKAGIASDVNRHGVRMLNVSSTNIYTSNIKIVNNEFNGIDGGDFVSIVAPTGANKGDNILVAGNTGLGNHRQQCALTNNNWGGNITISEETYSGGAIAGIRNRIVNGTFDISQRTGTSSNNITGGSAYTADRWLGTCSGAGSINMRPQTNTNFTQAGSNRYMQALVVTQAAPAAADSYKIETAIEGVDIDDFLIGTSNAKFITLAFWGRFSATGTYCVALQNSARDRSYVAEFVVTGAFSAQFYIIQIPLDNSGTWLTGQGECGLRVVFDLGSGTDFNTATPNTWVAGNYTRTAAAATFINTAVSQQWTVCAVRACMGGIVGRLPEPLPIALLDRICKRYYQKRSISVPASPIIFNMPIDMCKVPTSVTGGGAGFASTGTTADMLFATQTAQATQTIEITAEII